MKTDTQTAYSVLFRNEDGSLRGTIPGSTPECAIRAANPLEGQEVFGFATIRVEPEPISGTRFVLREVGPKAEPVVLTLQPSPQADGGEKCESGSDSCGPVEFHDVDGVPMCRTCWHKLPVEAQEVQW